jgi:hypothetical protein
MKNQLIKSNSFLTMIGMFLVLTFALSVSAQKVDNGGSILPVSSIEEDTSMNPHDFTDKYYEINGITGNFIIGRRTGYDLMSVIGWSSNPYHRNVRITATLPAYGSNGEVLFFSPLGEINDKGFTEDSVGVQAKEMADTDPIYVFPVNNGYDFAFGRTRQAALMDSSVASPNLDGYSTGLRSIMLVNYTKKAFSEEGVEMMNYMLKKNGNSLDGTPLIRSFEDLTILQKYELVSMEKRVLWDDTGFAGTYAISPIIYEPRKGGIAPDAFLITVTQKGAPLPGEQRFINEFNCLRKGGNWCSEF